MIKKLLILTFGFALSLPMFAQNIWKYETRLDGGVRIGGPLKVKIDSITTKGSDRYYIYSGPAQLHPQGVVLTGDTAVMFSKYARRYNPTFIGVIRLGTDTVATRAYARSVGGSGGSMTWPSAAGIPIYNGAGGWGTSITNNSANWDAAYSWGDHKSGGYATINSPIFMGTIPRLGSPIVTDTLATQAYARSFGGSGTVTIDNVRTVVSDSLTNYVKYTLFSNNINQKVNYTDSTTFYITPTQLAVKLNISDTTNMLSKYARVSTLNIANWNTAYTNAYRWDGGSSGLNAATGRSSLELGNVTNESKATMFTSPIFTGTVPRLGNPVTDTLSTRAYARSVGGTGGLSQQQVSNIVKDSIDAVLEKGIDLDTELAGYATQDQLSGREPALGNPVQNGYVLSSTTAGVRSWIAPPQGGGSEYDDTAINSRIDSLGAVVTALQIEAQDLRDEVNNLWSALAKLGDFDLVPPRFYSAEVGLHADDIVVITLDTADVDLTSVPPASAFTLWSDGAEHTIASTAFASDSLIYLTLDSAAVYGRVYTLDYTKGTPALKDPTGNETASWTGRAVVNNVAEPESEPENMIYNGDFSLGSTGWQLDIVTIQDGALSIVGGQNGSIVQVDASMNKGIKNNTSYTLTFIAVVSATPYVMISNYNSNVNYIDVFQLVVNGLNTFNFTTPNDIEHVGAGLKFNFNTNSSFTIDDIILVEE